MVMGICPLLRLWKAEVVLRVLGGDRTGYNFRLTDVFQRT